MADLSSTYRILGVDALTGPATKAEAALAQLGEHALRIGRETPFIRRKRSPWQRRRLRARSDGTHAVPTLTERRLRKKRERQNKKQGRR
jgi:hypothetical protein